jgi:ATP-binding cassette subfamily B protein
LENWVSDSEEGEALGVLLLLETTPAFFDRDDQSTSKDSWWYVYAYFKKHTALIGQLALGLFIGSILQLMFPFLVKSVIDVGIGTADMGFIKIALIAQAVLLLTQVGVEYVRSQILIHIGVRVNVSLISDFLIKLTRLPVRFFDSKVTGDLLQRITDHERVQRFLTSTTLVSVFSFVNIIAFSLLLFFWHPAVASVFLAGTVLYLLFLYWLQNMRREFDYKRFDQSAEHQSHLIELIDGMQEIILHNAEKQKRWNWERVQARLFRTAIGSIRIEQIQRAGATAINEGKNLIITLIVAKAVLDGDMTIGMLVAIQYVVGQLNTPLNQAIEFIASWQETKMSLERMNEIHSRQDEENLEEKITILPEFGDLIMDDVSFHYPGPHTRPILKNVNLHIPKGKTTAIVGSSGSGKTTMLKLLLAFYQPAEGSVRIGDVNLKNLNMKLWRSKCGVVMQDGFIFNDTIAKNIALGDEIVDKEKLLKAVKVANIQSFIESLPLGYNTKIGTEGLGLSQGQRQRMLIARAVYKNPEYMFFDEATTSLDAYNEMVIMENLEEFFRQKTVVIVAHRLSTVMNADNIVVLDGGEIVEQGTHEELTYIRGAYYHLVRNQLELGA